MVKSECSAYDLSVANISADTWNKLPVSTRNAENLAVFKKLLKKTSHKQNAIKPKVLLKQNKNICVKLDQW